MQTDRLIQRGDVMKPLTDDPAAEAAGEDLNRSYEAMAHLIAVVQELSHARDLDTVQAIVRRAARALTGADGATFVLRQGDLCYYADEDAIAPLWKGKRFPMATCVSGWAMLNRQPAVIEDIYADRRVPADAYRPTFVQSLVMVPIRAAAPIGAIGNYWARRHRATSGEIKLLQALADSASIALENVALYRELTERVEELKEANRLKSQFLSNVSHELRTPLNAILGYTELLIDGTYGRLKTDQRTPLEGVQRNAGDLLRLINDVLDLTRIEAGKIEIRTEKIDLVTLLQEIFIDIQPILDQKSLALWLDIPEGLPVIESDTAKVRQILANLLSNAAKFTDQGKVMVSAEEIPHRPGVEIAIRDTGIGIPKEALPKIFERFHQVDGSATREFGGVGLGLSIVKELVGLLGGEIRVESEVGNGSTFTLFLPCR
ncbi:MAG: GAF domain-containing sensor histidine kinase [Candidatus Manganitrophus sp.]|nr:GAF domain-containing sensor histidine kinase [Candidatus Manganitrophus sp.]